MFQVIHPPYKKVTLACIACLCFKIGVCPWPDLSALFQYTSPTPVVSLHLIPRIQYHPGIPVTLLTGSSYLISRYFMTITRCRFHNKPCARKDFITYLIIILTKTYTSHVSTLLSSFPVKTAEKKRWILLKLFFLDAKITVRHTFLCSNLRCLPRGDPRTLCA